MTKHRDVHIGQAIRQKLREKKIAVTQFAKMMKCSRTSVHYVFNTKSIDIEKLLFISSVLDYDFLEEYRLQN